jgi:hypothetical protein
VSSIIYAGGGARSFQKAVREQFLRVGNFVKWSLTSLLGTLAQTCSTLALSYASLSNVSHEEEKGYGARRVA